MLIVACLLLSELQISCLLRDIGFSFLTATKLHLVESYQSGLAEAVITLTVQKSKWPSLCLQTLTIALKKSKTLWSFGHSECSRVNPCYTILRIQRLEGKQCRARTGDSSKAPSSESALLASSAVFILAYY